MLAALMNIHSRPVWAALALGGALLAAGPAPAQEADADAENSAEEEEKPESEETPTIPIEVEAKELQVQPGHTKYGPEVLRNMPTGDGHLADLLRLNPAVDFSREGNLSGNTAVMRPDEISIHGQQFYQNLFLIDGIDTTNDLNPADVGDFPVWSGFLQRGEMGSSPQGYYVDVNLLKSIEVFDSNVSAEHGGFTGGVVEAELKDYDGENSYSVKFGMKRDEWEKFHADEPSNTNDYYNLTYTPDYLKRNYSISVSHELAEDLGLVLSASRRSSSFSQRYEKLYRFRTTEWDDVEYKDRIDNVLGRLNTTWRGHDVGLSFRFARRRYDGVISTTYDDRFDKDHEGYGVTGDFDGQLGGGRLDLKLGMDWLGDELDSASNEYSYHEYAEVATATESQYEGGYGDLEQEQFRASFKPKWTVEAAPAFIGGEHSISLGGELRYTNSFLKRPYDVSFLQYFCVDDASGRNGCDDFPANGNGVSGPEDEFLYRRVNYYAGQLDLHYSEWAFYVEDKIRFDHVQFNVGLRADRNSFLENTDVAPRLSVEWNPFGSGDSTLIAGASRYYGRSFMRLQLNDEVYGWRDQTIYCHANAVTSSQNCARSGGSYYGPDGKRVTTYGNRTGASDLDTPYSDEWMLGWTQAVGPFSARMQYVKRKGRDGISRKYENQDGVAGSEYYYTNEGRSSTESATLEITNETPLKLGPTETTFTLVVNYKNTDSNSQDEDGYQEQIDETDIIWYKGELITLDDLPAWDYNVPFGTRLFWTTEVPSWNLTWSNFVNWRRGGTTARDSGRNCGQTGYTFCSGGYDIYEDVDFESMVILDTKLQWQPSYAGKDYYVKVEVDNLLDKVVNVRSTSRSGSSRPTGGRVFWLEIGFGF